MRCMLVLCRTLGDVILANSLARDIKEYYGNDTEIEYYCNREYHELVRYNPDFSVINTSENWLPEWEKVLEKVINEKYIKVMIPQQLQHEDTIWHQMNYLRHQHLLNYYQLRCGLPVKKTPLIFYPDKQKTDGMPGNYFIVHCKSGNPDKDWRYFPEIIDRLRQNGYDTYQVGGEGDNCIVDPQFNLTGKYSFSEIWHLIKWSKGFIGLDSGLSMLAQTTGVKCFTLYGPTLPKTSGAYGDNVHAIVSPPCETCRPIRCHAHCRSKPNCIDRLTIDMVWKPINEYIICNEKVYNRAVGNRIPICST